MHVLATAGHVDHGKSALVRALTGREPDRWEAEQRRGLTLDLGFAWTDLDAPTADGRPGTERVALVDVPGHERFVPTMLAGVGPVPAVLLVVAADGGWMPQSQEHLDALDALGVRHGLLVLTRSDLADAGTAAATSRTARSALAGTTLADVPEVRVSALTGGGMDELRSALVGLVRSLPAPDPAAPVRLWLDRSFSIKGAGTVVTGTLPAGTVRVGDELEAVDPAGASRRVRVRSLQSLEERHDAVAAVARVAVNLRGVGVEEVPRSSALLTPGTAWHAREVDVVLTGAARRRTPADDERLPGELLLHLGAAQVTARVRPLGRTAPLVGAGGAGAEVVRLRLRSALPLRVGDTGLLRDPGRRAVVAGIRVLDVAPPDLARRGAGRERAADLTRLAVRVLAGEPAEVAEEVRRRGVVRGRDLVAMGLPRADVAQAAAGSPWLVDPALAERLTADLAGVVAEHARAEPLAGGVPVEAARHRLGLPSVELVAQLLGPALVVRDGRVVPKEAPRGQDLPPRVAAAVQAVLQDLAAAPFVAPDANRLRELGLGPRELAAAVRVGALERVDEGVVLAPGALTAAAAALRPLPAPFTASQARQAWGTSRRVAMPLLEALDAAGLTVRDAESRRRLA